MPAFSRHLDEEGVVIPPTQGRRAPSSRELAERMRNPAQRLADLRAQRAANLIGDQRLLEPRRRNGVAALRDGMAAILDYAERRTRAAPRELPDGEFEASDVLEDDAAGPERDVPLRVRATINGDSLRRDFAGRADQVDGNLNCPLSVTRSAARLRGPRAPDPDAPPSAGACRPIEITAPEGTS